MTSQDTPSDTPAAPARQRAANRPVGRDRVQNAILDAASELFGQRSPANVTLREIASRAGVNYGLIHHYYGSKESVVAEVFRRKSERGAEVIATAAHAEEALARLMAPTDRRGAYARMLAGALVEGATSEEFFRSSPAVTRLVELIEADWAQHGDGSTPRHDARIVAAALLTLGSGWGLFERFFVGAAELGDRTSDDLGMEMLQLARLLLRAVRPGGEVTASTADPVVTAPTPDPNDGG